MTLKKHITAWLACLSILTCPLTASADNALQRYLKRPESIASPLRFIRSAYDKRHHVTCYEFTLTSQAWPKPESGENTTLWEHGLTLCRPDKVLHDTALLFINGGTRHREDTKHNPGPAALNTVLLAEKTHSIILDLHDIPNQFLTFKDGVPRKEDAIVAYTWRQFLDAPDKGDTWPLYLPMTKAVVKAMDAAVAIAKEQWDIPLNHFVVAGASKRGWTTWLVALSDPRVSAIIPIVIDILNTKENIRHIYHHYTCQWPPAFHDYVAENITSEIDTPAFGKLMQIVDPLQYLKGSPGYQQRLAIPKYIISASGDDFFVPDSPDLYLNALPGETRIRVVPNQPHYIDMDIVNNAILVWYQEILSDTRRPAIQWDTSTGAVGTIGKPVDIRLWQATNSKNCDFRYYAGVRYHARPLQGECDDAGQCHYTATRGDTPLSGCRASFVEATFHDALGSKLTVTTPVTVQESAAHQASVAQCSASQARR